MEQSNLRSALDVALKQGEAERQIQMEGMCREALPWMGQLPW